MNNKSDSPNKADQGRSSFSKSSTTQGGSDYGQGSSQLAGSEAYKQGSAENAGSNYGNESRGLGSVGNKQQGGGGGYDAGREQQEINKEREEMHKERDPKKVNVEEPEKHSGNEGNPGKETPQPGTPGLGKK
jgi:hypothetical protein